MQPGLFHSEARYHVHMFVVVVVVVVLHAVHSSILVPVLVAVDHDLPQAVGQAICDLLSEAVLEISHARGCWTKLR